MTYEQLVDRVQSAYDAGEGAPWEMGLDFRDFFELFKTANQDGPGELRRLEHDINVHNWKLTTPFGLVRIKVGRFVPLHMI